MAGRHLKKQKQWSHQGWQAAAVPCGLAVVGVCIILGTAACMYFVLEGRAQAGKEETRLRHGPKFDRSHRDLDQRRSRYDRGSTHVMQEHQTSRREQQDKRGMVEVKINNPSEDGPRLQPQQQQQNEDEHDDDRGWVADSADSVLSRLVAAGSPAQRDQCFRPPCDEGKHIHDIWSDFGEEMAHVKGAVVVRRPGLTNVSDNIAPAHTLDFVTTLQSYFAIFSAALLPTKILTSKARRAKNPRLQRFYDAVTEGDTTAGRYLSSYYSEKTTAEVPKLAEDGYEAAPTVVAVADVFIDNRGFFWNDQDHVVPKSCKSEVKAVSASPDIPPGARRFEKVVVLAAHWGDCYYHFIIEGLPRIMPVLDVLLEHQDIKIAVHAPAKDSNSAKYMYEFLDLLGMDRKRIVFIQEPIFAQLAIVPESVACGKPNAALTNMLRTALLQGLYPTTLGVPPPLPRSTIVLIVRKAKRKLKNNIEVREALEKNFQNFDVVEFHGNGTITSQLQIFATASIIVAPHGAGLANTVVSPLHTPVLEIAPLSCPPCYINLSVKLQHEYGRHPSRNQFRERCDQSYTPDVGEVVNLVRKLLEAKRLVDAEDSTASAAEAAVETQLPKDELGGRSRR